MYKDRQSYAHSIVILSFYTKTYAIKLKISYKREKLYQKNVSSHLYLKERGGQNKQQIESEYKMS